MSKRHFKTENAFKPVFDALEEFAELSPTARYLHFAPSIEETQDKANRYARVNAAKAQMRAAFALLLEEAANHDPDYDRPTIYSWLENFHFDMGEKLS